MFVALEKRLISFGYTPITAKEFSFALKKDKTCLLYTSPSPRDQ